MKKQYLLSLIFFLIVPLSSCSSSSEIKIRDYSFSNNKITLNFDSDDYNSFAIYTKGKSDESFVYRGRTASHSYTYPNPNLDIKVVPVKNNKEISKEEKIFNYFSYSLPSDNIYVFDEDMSSNYITTLVNNTYDSLSTYEWAHKRPAFLLLSGNYDDLVVKNGYYTSFIGLGEVPTDVEVKKIETFNNPATGNALINFWRSNENFHVKEDSTWATSQAAPLRRMSFSKNLFLSCNDPGKENWSSGGFISNSRVDGTIYSGTQQQFYIRNSKLLAYDHANFNMVFEGVNANALPSTDNWEEVHCSVINKSYIVREKPHLIYNKNNGLGVRVYEDKINSSSLSWDIHESASFIPLNQFYVIKENDSSEMIQQQYDAGKHLLFTPGIYHINSPINIYRNDSIVLGVGFPTLIADNEQTIMNVSSKGATIASLLFQAGAHSESLINIDNSVGEDKTLLSDIFFRAGGEDITNTYVNTCINVNQDDTILDHLWVWRADHGEQGGIGWNTNISNQGIIIRGNNVTAHCLMVEHFEKYQTTWIGENGTMIFYQSETPYDAMEQEDWQRNDTESGAGYASYKVMDDVNNHHAIGVGVYYYQKAPRPIYCYSGIESPTSEGISLSHLVIRYFGGQGRILNTINDTQGKVDPNGEKCLMLEHFSFLA